MTLNNDEIELLKKIVSATQSNTIYYADLQSILRLTQLGYVEYNAAMTEPTTGNVACRNTVSGAEYAATLTAPQQPWNTGEVFVSPVVQAQAWDSPVHVQEPLANVSGEEITRGKGFVLPARSIRAKTKNKAGKYDLDNFEIGDWIFIAATPEKPDPKRSLSSTITQANKRGAQFAPRKYFKSVKAQKGQIFGSIIAESDGAFIVRVEPPVDKVAPKS